MSLDFNKVNKNGMKDYLEYVKNYIDYYNNVIYKNKNLVNALYSYKNGEFTDKFNLFDKNSKMIPVDIPYLKILLDSIKNLELDTSKKHYIDIVKEIKKELNKNKLIEENIINAYKDTIINIKYLDKIIFNAPISNREIVVFRVMNDIIDEFDKCENGDLVYTFPNYISTSLTLTTPYEWLGNKRDKRIVKNNALYKLIIPKGSMSIAIPGDIEDNDKFEDNYIDTQYEMLLPRNSKFKLISSKYISLKNETDYFFGDNYKINDISCLEKNKYKIKLYTLLLIKQDSLNELKKDYSHFNKKLNNLHYKFII